MTRVEFANGVVVNFNGNPTQRDIEEVAQKLGTTPKKTLKQDIKNIMSSRAEKLSAGYLAQMQGKQTLLESILQTAGQTAGAFDDIVFTTGGKLLSKITPDVIEKPVVSGAQKLISKAAQTPLVSGAVSKYQEFAEENPRAARNIGATANIAMAVPTVQALKSGEKIAQKAIAKTTKLTQKATKPLASVSEKTAKFGLSQTSGLSPETIDQIVQNPNFFSKKTLETINRESLGKSIKTQIDQRLNELSKTGIEYEKIRGLSGGVKVDTNIYKSTLSKYGLKLKDGKVLRSAESRPFTSGDIAKIEDFLQQYGKKELSPNAILNAREALSEMAKFETGKSSALTQWAKETRKALNDVAQKSIPGLKSIDIKYSAEKSILKEIKKDYFKKGTNEFKDNALSKLANLTKEGRQPVLNRLKSIDPNIEQKINILNAVEDIKKASGLKVGTYVRGGVAAGGLVSGRPGLLLGAIMAQPQILVPILKNYGKFTLKSKSFTSNLIKKLTTGAKLANPEKKFIKEAIIGYSPQVVEAVKKFKENQK